MKIDLNPKNSIEKGLYFLVSKGFTFKEACECRKAIQKFQSRKCDEFYKRIDSNLKLFKGYENRLCKKIPELEYCINTEIIEYSKVNIKNNKIFDYNSYP